MNYWLGLSKLVEERVVDPTNQPVFRRDSELVPSAWHAQFSGVAGAVTRVNGLIFSARNLWVDDLMVAVGALERSWQVIPGAAIRGVLGTQTGAAGALDVTDGQTQAVAPWSKYYYHYNDLGTVYATMTAAGDKLGVYEPDHFGNDRYVDGLRPDTMGLTGKFWDRGAAVIGSAQDYIEFASDRASQERADMERNRCEKKCSQKSCYRWVDT